MYFHFLIEDMSGEILIRHIMKKIQEENENVMYECKSFKGIGGLKKLPDPKAVKTDKLLNDLPMFLRALDKQLQGIPSSVIIVLDNDTRNTDEFKEQLERQAIYSMITIDYVFCIAVEEMEAWLLGDREALLRAYPHARESVLKDYKQDSICGTWEILAAALHKGGLKKFKKECQTYREIGKYRAEWADNIGNYMSIYRNISPSFQNFIHQIKSRIETA